MPRLGSYERGGSSVRALIVAASAVALFVALPSVAAGEPNRNILPLELTCGGETFDVVVPASGGGRPALFLGSTSVAVLQGIEGVFLTPGFDESELTTCTARFPDGSTITVFVLITPR
jgi:hypothetical protein